MQFTPQQLTGGPKFQHKVRVGNWSEDQELEDLKLKDFLKRKETGSLSITLKQQQLEASLVQRELSATPDGALHFGNQVMLASHQAKAFLAANPYDPRQKQHEAWILTTSANGSPCARNVFELVRASDTDGFDGDEVHYGQKIRLKLDPFASIGETCYVHSELVTALAAAKFSRHQEVCAIAAASGETLWQLLHPDVQARFESEGEVVPAGSPLVLRHVATGSFLASDEIPYTNLFGLEFEVHCFPYFSLSKKQNLTGEMKGEITGDYSLRPHGIPNIWTIVTATHGMEQAYEDEQ